MRWLLPLAVVLVQLVAARAATAAPPAAAGAKAVGSSCSPAPSTAITTTQGVGYWLTGRDGGLFGFGAATFGGADPGTGSPVVAVSAVDGAVVFATGVSSDGYYQVDAAGRVQTSQGAPFYGDLRAVHLASPIVGMAVMRGGYWLVASDGGVFAFGSAPFLGSMGGHTLAAPVVGMAVGDQGYWLVASDGGVFSFGGVPFLGSMGGTHLQAPIVGVASDNPLSSTPGYWLVASDGGVFAFGGARFLGSMGGRALSAPIVGMAVGSDVAAGEDAIGDQGYWLVAADGGIFAFGDAPFCGSMAGQQLAAPITGMAGRFVQPNNE